MQYVGPSAYMPRVRQQHLAPSWHGVLYNLVQGRRCHLAPFFTDLLHSPSTAVHERSSSGGTRCVYRRIFGGAFVTPLLIISLVPRPPPFLTRWCEKEKEKPRVTAEWATAAAAVAEDMNGGSAAADKKRHKRTSVSHCCLRSTAACPRPPALWLGHC